MRIEKNKSLKPFNTFGMDVQAEKYAAVHNLDDLQEFFHQRDFSEKLFVLGGGSNILFTRDVAGTVLHLDMKGIEKTGEDEDFVYIEASAGEVWHGFVLHCIAQGWAGVENLSLIPGKVGAAPMQNIGAYGVEVKDVFHGLEAYDIREKTFRRFGLEECRFGYRESVFKRELKEKVIIVSVTFRLRKNPVINTKYGAIEQELEKHGIHAPTIRDVSQAVIGIRQSKLPDPSKIGNAGSFFKNPVVSRPAYESIRKKFPDVVGYPVGDEMKLAAGWLIEKAGFKGVNRGNYGVHDRQALVLVNYGGASGREIYQLSSEIIEAIRGKFGVELEREVNVY